MGGIRLVGNKTAGIETLWLHGSTVDGLDLYTDAVTRPVGPVEVGMENRTGKDGAVVYGRWYRCPEVELSVWVSGGTSTQRRTFVRGRLARQLARGANKLYLNDEDGRYYEVRQSAQIDTEDHIDSMHITIPLVSAYPWMLGQVRTMTLSYDGSAQSMDVGGSIPTAIAVNGSVTPSSNEFTVSMRSGQGLTNQLRVYLNDTGRRNVYVDTEKRTATAGTSTPSYRMAATGSWLLAEPDETLRMQLGGLSSGTMTVTVQDRWL